MLLPEVVGHEEHLLEGGHREEQHEFSQQAAKLAFLLQLGQQLAPLPRTQQLVLLNHLLQTSRNEAVRVKEAVAGPRILHELLSSREDGIGMCDLRVLLEAVLRVM